MRTEYYLYHWPTDTSAANKTGPYPSFAEAVAASIARLPEGLAADLVSSPNSWLRTPDETGWTLQPWLYEAGDRSRSPWYIAESDLPESDAERVQLALELLAEHGQTDGDHHKAWVIDQTVRILTGDRYEHFIAEYRSEDGDGEPIYTWDEGIAP